MRKPNGYWKNWNNFESEMKEAIDENGGEFPSQRILQRMGRTSMGSAMVNYYGGVNAVREKLGFDVVNAFSWKDEKYFLSEMKKAIEDNGGEFPTAKKLYEMGRGSLAYVVWEYHGGMNAVREKLGFDVVNVPNWKDWKNVERKLRDTIEDNGGEFPTKTRLCEMGMSGLASIITRSHGGINSVRERMGYNLERKSKNHWKKWINLERELRDAIEDNGGKFPDWKRLSEMGRSSIGSAMANYHGGVNAVKKRMGYEIKKNSKRHWNDWKNIEKELRDAIEDNGGKFPTEKELRNLGKTGLLAGIFKFHGGIVAVREKMGYAEISSNEQFMNLLEQDEKARDLAAVAINVNGGCYDIERVIAELYGNNFNGVSSLHLLLQDNKEHIQRLIENGVTNLGTYLGEYDLGERAIIPILIGRALVHIPDTAMTIDLEDRLFRSLRSTYSPGFNENPGNTLAEVKAMIESTKGKERELYQRLQTHYGNVISLGRELK